MYDSERDKDFDNMVDMYEKEMDEVDRMAQIFEQHADKFMIAEDLEYIVTAMGNN